LRCEEAIVVTTTLTMKMTEEQIARLDARLRHVIQFSEASKQAAEEALALLEAIVEEAPKEGENGA
jgi:hypothetical protein